MTCPKKQEMLKKQTAITIRVDKNIKDESTRIFKSVGLNFNTAIEVYLRAVVREKRIPFDLVYDESIAED